MVATQQIREFVPGETDLRRAIERGEFEVHYQPIVSLVSGKIVAAEALVRWRHPEHGLLAPATFIEVCEETEVGVSLAEWVPDRLPASPCVGDGGI